MKQEHYAAAERPGTGGRTPEEIAERIAWLDQWFERQKELDKIEPLPDNFIEICKGTAWPPVYSRTRAL